jgi:hypothetical protein
MISDRILARKLKERQFLVIYHFFLKQSITPKGGICATFSGSCYLISFIIISSIPRYRGTK